MTDIDIIRANRNEGIGSSDAKRVVENDWHSLYQEKTGAVEPADLSKIFRVQLGQYTESFHLDWLSIREGFPLTTLNERHYHKTHGFMYCHLDGWNDLTNLPIEVKHSNGRAELREKAEFYMPQLQHVMTITGAKAIHFSIIAGNSDPEWCLVDRSDEYITKLIEMEKAFWWCVENKEPPESTPLEDQASLRSLTASVPIDGRIPYDMTGNNEWASLAADYIMHEQASKTFAAAKKDIKKLVPKDASSASGYGLTINRSKNGSLLFRKDED
jgi:hypothetical protein